MHDVRWTTTDDRVVLVLAIRRVTLGAALLQTDDFLEPEVPATWTLAEISANRAEIPNLRRRDRVRRFSKPGKTLAHTGMLLELTQRNERADRESARVKCDLIQSTNILEIHDARRTRRVILHRRKQVLPARNRPRRLINIADITGP